jgi:hypothetical protein
MEEMEGQMIIYLNPYRLLRPPKKEMFVSRAAQIARSDRRHDVPENRRGSWIGNLCVPTGAPSGSVSAAAAVQERVI